MAMPDPEPGDRTNADTDDVGTAEVFEGQLRCHDPVCSHHQAISSAEGVKKKETRHVLLLPF